MKSAEKPFVQIFSTLNLILTGLLADYHVSPDTCVIDDNLTKCLKLKFAFLSLIASIDFRP